MNQSLKMKVNGREKQSDEAVNVNNYERVASNVGGGVLAAYGLYRMDLIGLGLAALGGALLYRGTTGHCHAYQALGINTADGGSSKSLAEKGGTRVEKQITINRPPSEIYDFWRNFENLPKVMNNLESVQVLDERRSHWTAKAPMGTSVEWDAEITDEQKNRRISWRSLKGADVDNTGSVMFEGTNNGRSTDLTVVLEFLPPGGALGSAVAWLFGENPEQQLDEDLQKFKRTIERGGASAFNSSNSTDSIGTATTAGAVGFGALGSNSAKS